MSTQDVAAARAYAEQATATAAKLQPGAGDSIQASALTSIAHRLAAPADVRNGS